MTAIADSMSSAHCCWHLLAGPTALRCRRARCSARRRLADAGPTSADELALEQSRVADKYAKLEQLMLKMAELEGLTNPKRAQLLTRAVEQSKERLTKTQLEALVKLLNQKQLKRAARWPDDRADRSQGAAGAADERGPLRPPEERAAADQGVHQGSRAADSPGEVAAGPDRGRRRRRSGWPRSRAASPARRATWPARFARTKKAASRRSRPRSRSRASSSPARTKREQNDRASQGEAGPTRADRAEGPEVRGQKPDGEQKAGDQKGRQVRRRESRASRKPVKQKPGEAESRANRNRAKQKPGRAKIW